MAIYHLNVKIIGRNSGRSSVAATAYRSGDTLTNEWDGLTDDYSKKQWIEHSEIMLPDNAPESFQDRGTLWNAVEMAEKSGAAQLAREIEIALPLELNQSQHLDLVRSYIQKNFTDKGMCADFSIHNPPVTNGRGIPIDAYGTPTNAPNKMTFQNPHAHIMLTMRPLNDRGEWMAKSQLNYLCRKDNEEKSIPSSDIKEAEAEGWQKQYQYQIGKKKVWLTKEAAEQKDLKRVSKAPKSEKIQNEITADWNSKDSLFRWRESWAAMCNQSLKENGINQQIDHRSYEEQGVNQIATVHMGVEAFRAENRGIQTDRGNLNREILKDNEFLKQFEERIKKLEESETERLKQVSARLEGLRASYIAGAYQQICLSATLATEQDQNQTQMAIAAAYAKSAEQLMGILDTLGQSLEQRKKELHACSPIQIRRRKELESQLLETEVQIQEAKGRLAELDRAYKDKIKAPVSDSESLTQKRKQIQNLRKSLSVTYDEFYKLVDESKAQMKEIRDIIRGIRPVYDDLTEQELKKHHTGAYRAEILEKARMKGPELPEPEADGIKQNIRHRR